MKDSQFLQWIHDRLKNVHGEDEHYDYMHRLRDVIENAKKREEPETPVYADMCWDHDDDE